jgi:chemotaxis protein CheD
MPATEVFGPRWTIGIGGLEVVHADAGAIVTHALGSCLGICVLDPYAHVGGMLHAQLPTGARSPELARSEPARFVDLGLPLLVQRAIALGADKRRLRLTVAGAANMTGTQGDLFNVAAQNLTSLRKTLWRLGLLIAAEDTGGTTPRTMYLDLGGGGTTVVSAGVRKELT